MDIETRLRLAALSICALLSAACDRSPTTLTQPSGPSSNPGLPSPQLTVRVDSRGSAAAIVGVSEVTFDARGTPGDKLRYDLQFGDGSSATTALATHVYTTTGTFTATLTVIDAADRHSSSSATVVVKAVTGTWFYSDFNETTGRAEVHRIAIEEQNGAMLRGLYATPEETDRVITGTVTPERNVHLASADQRAQFDGLVSSDVLSDWSLMMRGGRINGQTLVFRRALGEPSSPSPSAHLVLTFDKQQMTFRGPLMGVTQIIFDASSSSGESLSYIIEYGDGEFTRRPSSVHAMVRNGSLDARVTVTDAFGRLAVASQRFGPVASLLEFSSVTDDWYFLKHWRSEFRQDTNQWETRVLQIATHDGLTFTGRYRHPEGWWSRFTGTLDGHGGLELMLVGGGITFTGEVRFTEKNDHGKLYLGPDFQLRARGGSADDRTLDFIWHESYD